MALRRSSQCRAWSHTTSTSAPPPTKTTCSDYLPLSELDARIRTEAVPDGLPFHHDGASLGRSKMWNLQCACGLLDIALEPAGGGYDHLAERARIVTVRGIEIPVADLADIVASKRLANRPKDQLVLPQLEDALAERNRGLE